MSTPTSNADRPLRLFEAFGVELEYMIVDARTLDVKPICDQLMIAACGSPESEIERAHGVSWSNELVNHVVELKTTVPTSDLADAGERFARSVQELSQLLKPLGARLLGTAMHPWMNPERETVLWPHEYSEVYRNFDRLFNCKRHGWANLQSMHLNLPFHGDEEFARLHAAVRLILPLLPALCASSPIADARITGMLDTRLDVYRSNQAKTPSLTGRVIPENVFSEDEYRSVIMEPIVRDVAKLDSSGIMQPQWMNSRGAIARFDRGSIEIRVMDVQDHPSQDLNIASGVVAALRWLCDEGPSDARTQRAIGVEPLRAAFDECVVRGDQAPITDHAYLRSLGWVGSHSPSASQLWQHVFSHAISGFADDPRSAPLRRIVEHGPLARRMLRALPGSPSSVARADLHALVARLADSLTDQPPLGASA